MIQWGALTHLSGSRLLFDVTDIASDYAIGKLAGIVLKPLDGGRMLDKELELVFNPEKVTLAG